MLGAKIAGGIIGVLAAIAFGIAGYIYCKSIRKNSKPISKNQYEYQEDEMDTL